MCCQMTQPVFVAFYACGVQPGMLYVYCTQPIFKSPVAGCTALNLHALHRQWCNVRVL